jgi:hypothetical protein
VFACFLFRSQLSQQFSQLDNFEYELVSAGLVPNVLNAMVRAANEPALQMLGAKIFACLARNQNVRNFVGVCHGEGGGTDSWEILL